MEKSFWDRVQELRESINGGVEPMDEVRLHTRVIRIALGMYLIQTATIALWWSVNNQAFYPWLFFMSAVLQVGWFWNKVTESWRIVQGYTRVVSPSVEDTLPLSPPAIDIRNTGVTGNTGQGPESPVAHPLSGSNGGGLWGSV